LRDDLTFFTCFSNGSGHALYLEGQKVMESGWTDLDFVFPSPTNALDFEHDGVGIRMSEEDAWMGEQCLAIDLSPSFDSRSAIPLFGLDTRLANMQSLELSLAYKALPQTFCAPVLKTAGGTVELSLKDIVETKTGWTIRRWCGSRCEETLKSLSLQIDGLTGEPVKMLVGAISISAFSPTSPTPRIVDVTWDKTSRWVEWRLAHHIESFAEKVARPLPAFLFFTIWHIPDGYDQGGAVVLGTTAEYHYSIEGHLEAGAIVVRGVDETGQIEPWNKGVTC
jgi:hypothetical protein